jgi:hypothetical protein
MNSLDSAAARAFENSAIVQRIERGAMRLRVAASSSILITRGRSWLRDARPHAGRVLVAAAATHLLLMITIGRPLSWHFAILPSLFLLAGAVLIATSTRTR